MIGVVPSPDELVHVVRYLRTYHDGVTNEAISYLLGMYEEIDRLTRLLHEEGKQMESPDAGADA